MENTLIHVNESLASAFLNNIRVRIVLEGQEVTLDPYDLASGNVSPQLRIFINFEDPIVLDILFGLSNPLLDVLRNVSATSNSTLMMLKPAWNPFYATSRGWFAVYCGEFHVYYFLIGRLWSSFQQTSIT